MEKTAVLDEQASEETPISTEVPRRKRGRPLKSETDALAPAKQAKDVTGPRHKSYDSNHLNRNQRTSAAWAWWNALPQASREICDLSVYRDWPRLLDPTDEKETKSIEVIVGTQPIQTDQDFVDKFGAGNYRCYFNVSPKGEAKRTLFTAYVKCTHDFRAFPPSDRRIDIVSNIDTNDPDSRAYVALLKSQGKIPDEAKESKEKEEMATATQGLTEVLGKALDRGDRLMEKLIEERTEPETQGDPPPSAEEKLNESLSLLEKLQNFTAGKPTSDPIAMVTAVIEAAKVLAQSNNQNPASMQMYIDRIDQLQDRLRVAEVDGLKAQLSDIRAQLTAKESATPNLLSADGKSLEGIVQRVVEQVIDKPEVSPWPDIIKNALPMFLPILGGIAQRFMTPVQPAPAFPMPPGNFQAGAQQSQQAQLPAPGQPQPTPQPAQPQGGAYTTGNPQLDALLMAVVIPLADCLRDGETGAVFAEEFIETQGIEVHAMLAQVGVEPIANIIAAYPPLVGVMKKITREKLLRFVSEFVEYKPVEVPAGA